MLGSAIELAYPIGFLLLVLIVVGAATVARKRSGGAWVALAVAFTLVAVPSAVNATTAPSSPVAFSILNAVAWPTAILILAASMWVDPGVVDPMPVSRGSAVWIPAVASGAAIAVLLAATARRVDHAATALAAAALVLVMLRGYGELRHEIAARRARTEEGLRASDARYRQVADEQAALRRVATLVAQGAPPSEVFATVTDEVGRVLNTDITWLRRYLPGPSAATIAAFAGGKQLPQEEPRPLGGHNVATLVYETQRSARLRDSDWLLHDWSGQLLPFTFIIGAPIVVDGSLWGAMAVAWSTATTLQADTESRLAGFTELMATAIANAEARDELSASRARVVASADEARRRIQRDLHDGAQQSLVSVALKLKLAEHTFSAGDGDVMQLIHEAAQGTEHAIEEVGEISRGIHPAVLTRSGLAVALKTLASRSPVPVVLDVDIPTRLSQPTEATAYFVISEALTNTAKYSRASEVHISATAIDGEVRISVDDDGVGGANPANGSGLVGLRDRVEAVGGTFSVRSESHEGTHLVVELPLLES